MVGIKEIAFLTGTRADYGKLKSLMNLLRSDKKYKVSILVTGMHLLPKYGLTINQIIEDDLGEITILSPQNSEQKMEITLSKTIENISNFVDVNPVELLVVHGDRMEALAGAVVGAIRNIPVAHIEGGEVSGTIDGLIRHSITKLSHLHFVANSLARQRLIQLGEQPKSIFEIGSPDVDIMFSNTIPDINTVKQHYGINFSNYSIVIFHPITTEIGLIENYVNDLCTALLESELNYVVIKPNNDWGSEIIQEVFNRRLVGSKFRHIPSMRFEYFLSLLKNCKFIIGNSSSGIREAPYYGVSCINIGTRQRNRSTSKVTLNSKYDSASILNSIREALKHKVLPEFKFGDGTSASKFKTILDESLSWPIVTDKIFYDVE